MAIIISNNESYYLLPSHDDDYEVLNTSNMCNSKKKKKFKLKVLMVEDQRICQLAQLMVLESYGCEVDIASTGKEALTKFQKNNYDVVFLDINLPDMNGVEICRSIRSMLKNDSIPIIGISSEAKRLKTECLAAGFDQTMKKPLDSEKLGKILQDYFPLATIKLHD